MILVRMWGAETSDGEVLFSKGFTRCRPVIIASKKYDPKLGRYPTMLCHIVEDGYTPEQISKISQFCIESELVAIPISGNMACSTDIMNQLSELGIEVLPPIKVDTGDIRWNVQCDPKTLKIDILRENGSLIKTLSPFQKRTPLPPDERGLSAEERVALHLKQEMNLRQPHLSNDHLKRIYQLTQQGGFDNNYLISHFTEENIKRAGLNPQSYPTIQEILKKTKPTHLELVYRKMQIASGGYEGISKIFNDAEIDLQKVQVSPSDIVQLFQVNHSAGLLNGWIKNHCPSPSNNRSFGTPSKDQGAVINISQLLELGD